MKAINESKRQWWQNQTEAAEKYSGSIEEFCRSRQLTVHTFRYWKKKFAKESRTMLPLSSFVAVEVTRSTESAALPLPDPRWLAALIRELQVGGVR